MRSEKLSLPIDATKYDIRALWTGLKEEHVSPDAGVVEGYPLDPPEDGAGWFLVDWRVESTKEADRYWTLWAREKKAAKKPRTKKQKQKTDAQPEAAEAPKKRGRKARNKPPEEPKTVLDSVTTSAEPETN
jgi:hypothetical protein